MERCYNKFESQTSFASRFKTQIDDDRMFCDYFNPKDQTFCKRLQVWTFKDNLKPHTNWSRVVGCAHFIEEATQKGQSREHGMCIKQKQYIPSQRFLSNPSTLKSSFQFVEDMDKPYHKWRFGASQGVFVHLQGGYERPLPPMGWVFEQKILVFEQKILVFLGKF